MDTDLRVPPAVTLQFERFALAVCEEAKLDFEQWASKSHELIGHLQQLWREGVEMGLSTDGALERTFEIFGSVRAIAYAVRQPWLRRFLLWRRYQGQRFAIFLSAAVVCAYMYGGITARANPELYKGGSPGFYFVLGTSMNGAMALGSLALVQWRPLIQSPVGRALFSVRWLVAPVLFTGAFNVLMPTFTVFPLAVLRVISHPSTFESAILPGLAAGLGLLGGLGYLSELFRFPHRRSAKLQKELLLPMAG